MTDKKTALIVALASVIASSAEGLRQYAYRDPVGILTVCYGHTGDVQKGKKYSLDECKALLSADMLNAVSQVNRCHPDLPDRVAVAFSDAVFNLGPAVACDSTASRYLDAGEYDAACDQLLRWDKAKVAGVYVTLPGLTKRRQKEREICRGLQ